MNAYNVSRDSPAVAYRRVSSVSTNFRNLVPSGSGSKLKGGWAGDGGWVFGMLTVS